MYVYAYNIYVCVSAKFLVLLPKIYNVRTLVVVLL